MLEDKDGWHIRGKNRHLIVNLVDPTPDARCPMIDESSRAKLEKKNVA